MQRQHSLQYIRMKMICHSKFIITICVWCVGTLVHNSLRVTLSLLFSRKCCCWGKRVELAASSRRT